MLLGHPDDICEKKPSFLQFKKTHYWRTYRPSYRNATTHLKMRSGGESWRILNLAEFVLYHLHRLLSYAGNGWKSSSVIWLVILVFSFEVKRTVLLPAPLSSLPYFFISVFYDYGKCLFQACPFPPDLKHPATNNYFMSNVNHVMKRFPNLQMNSPNSPIANLKIEVGSARVRKYSPEAFVRVNARNGFISRIKSLKGSAALW